MSTIKVQNIQHTASSTNAIALASDGTCTANLSNRQGKNLVINGAMQVAQRGTVTGQGNGYGGADRFKFSSNYSAVTMSQSTDVPSAQGFSKSLKLDVTTAGGDSNSDTYTQLDYNFEGQDLITLKYGTSSAEATTLSFWIKSPKAGIHWVRLYGDELTNNAFISRKYTVSTANTWQKITLNFPAYTISGFDNDNTRGMRISWFFAQGSVYSSGTAQADDGGWLEWSSATDRARNTVGQVNCFDSTSNDIYLTGVQLEVGSVATDFEHLSYGDTLAKCQRYFQTQYAFTVNDPFFHGYLGGGNGSRWYPLPVTMRSAPTVTLNSHTQVQVYESSGWTNRTISVITSDQNRAVLSVNSTTHNYGKLMQISGGSTYPIFYASAEL